MGLERGKHLLNSDELNYLNLLCSLPADEGGIFARLWLRKPGPYDVDALSQRWGENTVGYIAQMVSAGLLIEVNEPAQCLPKMTVPQLKYLARAARVSTRGPKLSLVSRLLDTDIQWDDLWVGIPQRRLLTWLTQWCFLRKHPPIQTMVLERLGKRVWPEYAETPGKWGFDTRVQLDEWWNRFETLETGEASLEQLFYWIEYPVGPYRFSLRRTVERFIWTYFDGFVSVGDYESCLNVLERLSTTCATVTTQHLNRHVRLLEQMDEVSKAYLLLAERFSTLSRVEQHQFMPLARRLGRKRNVGWKPLPILEKAKVRTLTLRQRGTSGRRPQYEVEGEAYFVEDGVRAYFQRFDATLVRAEGGFLTSLYALFFSSIYFLPKGEMLPVRFLKGPLDVGRPAFFDRLEEEIERVLTDISHGRGCEMIQQTFTRFEGMQLAGMQWGLLKPKQWQQWVQDIGPERLERLVRFIVKTGFRETAGFPDLVWVCGDVHTIPNAFPRRVRQKPSFIEVKSPSDSMSHRQSLWMDRLIRMGFAVEQWDIEHAES